MCIRDSAKVVDKRYKEHHEHAQLVGGRNTRQVEVYPKELCRTILKGLRNQMIEDGRLEEPGSLEGMRLLEKEWSQ